MKITVVDRIALFLVGILLLALGGLLLYGYVTGGNSIALASLSLTGMPAALLGAVPLLTGLYLLIVALRREGKTGFVLQKTENGSLNISMKALEALVRKCTEHHPELQVERMHLTDTRDGLMVHLRVSMPAGLNIPLVVSMLQKEIKQYVTACSGVDVKAVLVQVEHSTAPMKPSPYIVSELLPPAAQKEALPPPVEGATTPTDPVSPAPQHTQPLPVEAEVEEVSDDRPFHQQLFSHEDEPVTVPAPPAAEENPGVATVETEAPPAAAASVEDGPAHGTDQPESKQAFEQETAPTHPLSASLDDALKQEWAETDHQPD